MILFLQREITVHGKYLLGANCTGKIKAIGEEIFSELTTVSA